MIEKNKKSAAKVLLMLILLCSLSGCFYVIAQVNEATRTYDEAEKAIKTAYSNMLILDSWEYDVYDYQNILNKAIRQQLDSEESISKGDYSTASIQSREALELANIVIQTTSSSIEGEEDPKQADIQTTLIPFALIIPLGLVWYLTWKVMKIYYIKQKLEMELEVIQNES